MRFNRLLDYRSLERLERMTDTERTELLTEVLRREPAEPTWRALYELFATWPDNEGKVEALQTAERALDGWDDRLRLADTASTDLFDGTRLSSLARLVRSIRIYRRGDGGGSELAAVVTSEEAAGLTRLSIVRSEIGDRAWHAMAESPYLARLEHLHVTNTTMTSGVVQRILGASTLPRLTCLRLTEVGLDARYLPVAPQAGRASALRQIDFSRNLLADEGAQRLAQGPCLQTVERLTLQHNFIREPGMRALLTSPFIPRLTRIDLSDNRVSEPERAALVRLAASRQIEATL